MYQSYNLPCSGICGSLKNVFEVTRAWKMEVTGLLGKLIIGGNVFRIYTFVLIEKIYPLNTCFNIFIFISLYTTKIYSGYPNWLWSWQKYKARGSTFSKSYVPLSSHCRGNSKIYFFGEGVVQWTKKLKTYIEAWYLLLILGLNRKLCNFWTHTRISKISNANLLKIGF